MTEQNKELNMEVFDPKEPPALETSEVNTEPEVDTPIGEEYPVELPIKVAGEVVNLQISKAQMDRIKSITRPKPVLDELNAQQVTADHQISVANWAQLVLNRVIEAVEEHDSKKLEQTVEEHHKEPHHWPLDGGPENKRLITAAALIEAVADYLATMFGRYLAGREKPKCETPTSTLLSADMLTSTIVDVLLYYDLATETSQPQTSQEESDA